MTQSSASARGVLKRRVQHDCAPPLPPNEYAEHAYFCECGARWRWKQPYTPPPNPFRTSRRWPWSRTEPPRTHPTQPGEWHVIIWPPAAAWVYQEFDGTWIAECEVRPGCFAGGATPEEAQRLLAEVRKTWDEANAMKERHQ